MLTRNARETDKDIKRISLEKTYEYQFSLITRRWQSFVAYLLVNGLLLNAMSGSMNELNIEAFAISGILLANIFIRCISIMTDRATAIQLELQHSGNQLIVHIPPKSFSGPSMTTMLYCAIFILAIPWFIFLWEQSTQFESINSLAILFVLSFVTLINFTKVTW